VLKDWASRCRGF